MELAPRIINGRPELVAGNGVTYDSFERHAQAIVERFHMKVERKIDGLGGRAWVVAFNGHNLRISWDDWMLELIVAGVNDDSAEAMETLQSAA